MLGFVRCYFHAKNMPMYEFQPNLAFDAAPEAADSSVKEIPIALLSLTSKRTKSRKSSDPAPADNQQLELHEFVYENYASKLGQQNVANKEKTGERIQEIARSLFEHLALLRTNATLALHDRLSIHGGGSEMDGVSFVGVS